MSEDPRGTRPARPSEARRRGPVGGARIASLLLSVLPAAAQDGLPSGPYDAALRWQGERHGTLGPTGRRVFALELEAAPGLRGRFACGDATVLLPDPLRLEVLRDGVPLELAAAGTTWRPSRLEATWTAGGLRVLERKLITADDALVDELELANVGAEPLDLELRVCGGATPLLERFTSRQVPLALADAATLARADLLRDEARAGLATLAGATVLDGVVFALPEANDGAAPAWVALRGGPAGDVGRGLPEQIALPLPDERPAIVTLHLLLAAPGAPDGVAPAQLEVALDDGSSEAVAWPAGAAPTPDPRSSRVEWRTHALPGLAAPALQLAYTPPPGRFLRELRLRSGLGARVPLLLAATLEVPRETGRLPLLVGEAALAGLPLHVALALTDAVPARTPDGERCLRAQLQLLPGAARRVRAVALLGTRRLPTALAVLDLVRDEELVARHVEACEGWFERHVPGFACSDPWLETAWRQRWYVVRRNLLSLDLPDFSLPVAYEGTCCARHARVAPGAGAAALRELRWLRDLPAAQGLLRALLKLQREDGLLVPVSPHTRGEPESHALAAEALGAFAATGSRQLLAEVLSLLERDLEATLRLLGADRGELPRVPGEAFTRMPGRPLVERAARASATTPIDVLCRLESSGRALAEGHRALGAPERGARLDALAERLRAAVLERCWSDDQAWFLSLDGEGRRVAGREIAGLLPLATGLAPPAGPRRAALETLVSPRAFWGPRGVRSLARDDPAWLRAPRGAALDPLLWNGPVRPEAVVWSLDALADADDARWSEQLDALTRLLFEGGDAERAITREAYDPESGAGAGCADVLRAAYADLLIRYVAGLRPRLDGALELRPLAGHLEHFRFTRVPYRGRSLDVTWDRPDGHGAWSELGLPEGFTVDVDGTRVHHGAILEPLLLR